MIREYVNIGFGSIVSARKLVAVVSPDSAPMKRLVSVARDQERLVDATHGRRTRSVLVMDRGQIILSAVQTDTLLKRLNGSSAPETDVDASFDEPLD